MSGVATETYATAACTMLASEIGSHYLHFSLIDLTVRGVLRYPVSAPAV